MKLSFFKFKQYIGKILFGVNEIIDHLELVLSEDSFQLLDLPLLREKHKYWLIFLQNKLLIPYLIDLITPAYHKVFNCEVNWVVHEIWVKTLWTQISTKNILNVFNRLWRSFNWVIRLIVCLSDYGRILYQILSY